MPRTEELKSGLAQGHQAGKYLILTPRELDG
jgi:hypothetical protein